MGAQIGVIYCNLMIRTIKSAKSNKSFLMQEYKGLNYSLLIRHQIKIVQMDTGG